MQNTTSTPNEPCCAAPFVGVHLASCPLLALIARARNSRPELTEPNYSRGLNQLIDEAERRGADDTTIRNVIHAYQDAALAMLDESTQTTQNGNAFPFSNR